MRGKGRLIKVSIGTAALLGLTRCRLDAKPTTAYLMTHSDHRCTANCAFCTQAKESNANGNRLSRVTWPAYPEGEVLRRLEGATQFQRICIQVLRYPGFFEDLTRLVAELRAKTSTPISTSCQPLNRRRIRRLKDLGLDTLAIPLDAATPGLFDRIKGESTGGPYRWKRHIEALKAAIETLGLGRVYTHLIVGLGESERDAAGVIQRMMDMDVVPGLFAFTPLKGTRLADRPPPSVASYRRVQLARHLILSGLTRLERMSFNGEGRIAGFGVGGDELDQTISSGTPFMTSGCPGCNRPYYTERPSGPLYNYPYPPSPEELDKIRGELSPLG